MLKICEPPTSESSQLSSLVSEVAPSSVHMSLPGDAEVVGLVQGDGSELVTVDGNDVVCKNTQTATVSRENHTETGQRQPPLPLQAGRLSANL